MKYYGVIMWIDTSQYDAIRSMLKTEFGLVPPKPNNETEFRPNVPVELPELTEEERLVYEDGPSNGVYRVEFREEGSIWFRYWIKKLTDDIKEEDPLLEAVRRVYDEFNPTDWSPTEGMALLKRTEDRP